MPEAQVVRPPGFLDRIHRKDPPAGFFQKPVIHVFKIIGAVDAAHVAVQHLLIGWLIWGRLSKSPVEKSPSAGVIRMSVGFSSENDFWTFCSVRC
jgi:hypothetical protein